MFKPFCRSLFVLLLGAAALTAHAQFQNPTPEELKMTTDPKAPGADAVYLNVEEKTDDMLHYESYYARIKVLTEKGKNLATVELPYLRGATKVSDIKGRTIQPDGTIVPLATKADDLLVAKSGDTQVGRKVFTLPNAQVGSILEYYYQIRYDDNRFSSPEWTIQKPYFVHKAHYAFLPFKTFQAGGRAEASSMYLVDDNGDAVNTLIWWHNLPKGVEVKGNNSGQYTVDVTDVPPTPSDDWMPPIHSLLYRVEFYYKSSRTTQEYWTLSAKSWSKYVDHFTDPTKTIHQAVDAIVAATDTPMDKARKLYKAVQALDNTNFSRSRSESEMHQLKLKENKRAEDVWTQKSGYNDEIAMLYLSMLRAAGIEASGVRVVNRDRAIFDISYMSTRQFDDTLVIVKIDGKEMLLDPGQKMCPFGLVHWKHSDVGGLRQSNDAKYAIVTNPQDYRQNKTIRSGDLTVEANGNTTGQVRFTFSGQEAMKWRQRALTEDEKDLKHSFEDWANGLLPEGIAGKFDHFIGLDDEDVNLIAIVSVHGALGASTAHRLLVPGFFFESRGHEPFVHQDDRTTPVDMEYGLTLADQVTYHLPAAMNIEGVPADDKATWLPKAQFITRFTTDKEKHTITAGRLLARSFALASPTEYKDLRDFYQKVANNDQQQVVLKVTAEVGGPAVLETPAAKSGGTN